MRYKVMFIIPDLSEGGAQRVFANLINHINKDLFDVKLLYLHATDNDFEVTDDIEKIILNVNRLRNAPLKILKFIRQYQPDIIISTQEHMNILIMFLKIFLPRKTKVILRQTSIVSSNKKRNLISRNLHKTLIKLYKNADKIICQSKFMKNDFIKYTGIKSEKLIEIFNPVDIKGIAKMSELETKNYIDENSTNIFFMGRLAQVKRVPIIIQAFNNYLIKNPNSYLYILGEGEQKETLVSLVHKLGINERVKFLGFIKNPYPLLKQADLFVMASEFEGMPNALIEAISLEIPILVLKHPGGTIDVLNVLNLADLFVDNLEITEKAFKKYSKDVKEKLKRNFGVSEVMSKYEDLFLEIINNN